MPQIRERGLRAGPGLRDQADGKGDVASGDRLGAVLIAGTHSGCGKTTLTLGLMAALGNRGCRVQPFKCGPDFIDPTLHRWVTGRSSRNLDPWMCGPDFVRQIFARGCRGADVGVIEGVMGMFDGGPSSSAVLAGLLGVPLVLVLDVRSAAESAAAVLKGFETLMPEVAPVAVILNRVGSPRHLQLLQEAIAKHCRAEVIGHLPRELDFSIPERHLGLHMGEEEPMPSEGLAALAQAVAEGVDLDRLLALAAGAHVPEFTMETGTPKKQGKVRIGIARDPAFCFYYEDNLDLLAAAGAELVPFSPLADERLPENLAAIYLGGGYPELHARRLADNRPLLAALKEWAEAGRPLYAECGGFMALTEGIEDQEGCFHPMAGIFPVRARMLPRRAALGYREVRLRQTGLFGPAGTCLRGHEFHYSEIGPMPATIERLYEAEVAGYRYQNVEAGYLHLHLGSNQQAARAFVEACGGLSMNEQLRRVAPGEIEAESFRIIEAELGEHGFDPQTLSVVRRVIHATGDFSFADSLRFHPEAIAAGIEAIRAGKNVLADVNMAAAGIGKGLLARWGGEVLCGVALPEVAAEAKREGRTRSEVAIARLLDDSVGLVAIGNAPTALLEVLALSTRREPRRQPPLVVGVPVGFVNAAESKAILAEQAFPFITCLGRKGGSPVAAAIVNALLRLALEE